MPPANLNGLELLKAMAAGLVPPPTIAETVPMKFVSIEEGKVVFEATADDRHLNPLGGVHGGFSATVLDSVTGCAIHSLLEPGVGYSTIDLNVKMVRPIPRHTPLLAEGRAINTSKSLGISEGTLKDAEGKIYAHATASLMIFR